MTKFGIGQSVRRVEDQRFLTGNGDFVGDMALSRQCYGVCVLSPQAHAKIVSIDATPARAAPGVVCVLTGADAHADGLGGIPPHFMPKDWGGPDAFATIRPLLMSDRVRCVGDRVAFVVAESEAQARDAAERVQIEYEPLPAVIAAEDAIKPDIAPIWPDCPTGNIGATVAFSDPAATDAAFAGARHVVKLRLVNNRVSANPIEPRSALGHYEAGGFTLYTTSQDPHGVRSTLARAVFNLAETSFRVIAPDVGGGFGMKSNAYPEDALVLWASRRCGRPVKWTATRTESLLTDTHGRDQVIYGELALDGAGKILGIRARAYQSLGAYWWGAATAPLYFSLMMIPSLYAVPAVDLSASAVFTNTAPTSVYRGAGRPEAIYFIERMIDQAARVTGFDRVELRRRNLIRPDALPYHTPTHHIYDSGEFERVMDRCLTLADWDGFARRKADSAKRGKLRGRAVTPYIEVAGVFNDRMELRFDPSGALSIIAGTHSHGQGHATVFAQLVSEWLGVPFETIRYIQGDTEKVSIGRGTFAARSSMVGGCALRFAADAIIAKAKPMAGALMEAAVEDVEFADGSFSVVGTDRKIALTDVAKAFFAPAGPVIQFGLGLDAAGSYSGVPGGAPNYPNGCQVCEVEVDPDTGAIAIVRFTAVDDLGRVINPLICEGQIHGGIAQGVGQALLENVGYDPQTGQLLSGSFMDYAMPRAENCPGVVSELLEIPARTNPLGIKGIGESGTIAAPPTIVNAVIDALQSLNIGPLDMPLTPHRVWQAIQAAKHRGGMIHEEPSQ